jgi:protein KRI1
MPNVNPLKEKEQQDEDFARFQAKAERRGDNADAVMSNYWRADEDLNEDERFLRDYVMNRQWLETDSLSPGI